MSTVDDPVLRASKPYNPKRPTQYPDILDRSKYPGIPGTIYPQEELSAAVQNFYGKADPKSVKTTVYSLGGKANPYDFMGQRKYNYRVGELIDKSDKIDTIIANTGNLLSPQINLDTPVIRLSPELQAERRNYEQTMIGIKQLEASGINVTQYADSRGKIRLHMKASTATEQGAPIAFMQTANINTPLENFTKAQTNMGFEFNTPEHVAELNQILAQLEKGEIPTSTPNIKIGRDSTELVLAYMEKLGPGDKANIVSPYINEERLIDASRRAIERGAFVSLITDYNGPSSSDMTAISDYTRHHKYLAKMKAVGVDVISEDIKGSIFYLTHTKGAAFRINGQYYGIHKSSNISRPVYQNESIDTGNLLDPKASQDQFEEFERYPNKYNLHNRNFLIKYRSSMVIGGFEEQYYSSTTRREWGIGSLWRDSFRDLTVPYYPTQLDPAHFKRYRGEQLPYVALYEQLYTQRTGKTYAPSSIKNMDLALSQPSLGESINRALKFEFYKEHQGLLQSSFTSVGRQLDYIFGYYDYKAYQHDKQHPYAGGIKTFLGIDHRPGKYEEDGRGTFETFMENSYNLAKGTAIALGTYLSINLPFQHFRAFASQEVLTHVLAPTKDLKPFGQWLSSQTQQAMFGPAVGGVVNYATRTSTTDEEVAATYSRLMSHVYQMGKPGIKPMDYIESLAETENADVKKVLTRFIAQTDNSVKMGASFLDSPETPQQMVLGEYDELSMFKFTSMFRQFDARRYSSVGIPILMAINPYSATGKGDHPLLNEMYKASVNELTATLRRLPVLKYGLPEAGSTHKTTAKLMYENIGQRRVSQLAKALDRIGSLLPVNLAYWVPGVRDALNLTDFHPKYNMTWRDVLSLEDASNRVQFTMQSIATGSGFRWVSLGKSSTKRNILETIWNGPFSGHKMRELKETVKGMVKTIRTTISKTKDLWQKGYAFEASKQKMLAGLSQLINDTPDGELEAKLTEFLDFESKVTSKNVLDKDGNKVLNSRGKEKKIRTYGADPYSNFVKTQDELKKSYTDFLSNLGLKRFTPALHPTSPSQIPDDMVGKSLFTQENYIKLHTQSGDPSYARKANLRSGILFTGALLLTDAALDFTFMKGGANLVTQFLARRDLEDEEGTIARFRFTNTAPAIVSLAMAAGMARTASFMSPSYITPANAVSLASYAAKLPISRDKVELVEGILNKVHKTGKVTSFGKNYGAAWAGGIAGLYLTKGLFSLGAGALNLLYWNRLAPDLDKDKSIISTMLNEKSQEALLSGKLTGRKYDFMISSALEQLAQANLQGDEAGIRVYNLASQFTLPFFQLAAIGKINATENILSLGVGFQLAPVLGLGASPMLPISYRLGPSSLSSLDDADIRARMRSREGTGLYVAQKAAEGFLGGSQLLYNDESSFRGSMQFIGTALLASSLVSRNNQTRLLKGSPSFIRRGLAREINSIRGLTESGIGKAAGVLTLGTVKNLTTLPFFFTQATFKALNMPMARHLALGSIAAMASYQFYNDIKTNVWDNYERQQELDNPQLRGRDTGFWPALMVAGAGFVVGGAAFRTGSSIAGVLKLAQAALPFYVGLAGARLISQRGSNFNGYEVNDSKDYLHATAGIGLGAGFLLHTSGAFANSSSLVQQFYHSASREEVRDLLLSLNLAPTKGIDQMMATYDATSKTRRPGFTKTTWHSSTLADLVAGDVYNDLRSRTNFDPELENIPGFNILPDEVLSQQSFRRMKGRVSAAATVLTLGLLGAVAVNDLVPTETRKWLQSFPILGSSLRVLSGIDMRLPENQDKRLGLSYFLGRFMPQGLKRQLGLYQDKPDPFFQTIGGFGLSQKEDGRISSYYQLASTMADFSTSATLITRLKLDETKRQKVLARSMNKSSLGFYQVYRGFTPRKTPMWASALTRYELEAAGGGLMRDIRLRLFKQEHMKRQTSAELQMDLFLEALGSDYAEHPNTIGFRDNYDFSPLFGLFEKVAWYNPRQVRTDSRRVMAKQSEDLKDITAFMTRNVYKNSLLQKTIGGGDIIADVLSYLKKDNGIVGSIAKTLGFGVSMLGLYWAGTQTVTSVANAAREKSILDLVERSQSVEDVLNPTRYKFQEIDVGGVNRLAQIDLSSRGKVGTITGVDLDSLVTLARKNASDLSIPKLDIVRGFQSNYQSLMTKVSQFYSLDFLGAINEISQMGLSSDITDWNSIVSSNTSLDALKTKLKTKLNTTLKTALSAQIHSALPNATLASQLIPGEDIDDILTYLTNDGKVIDSIIDDMLETQGRFLMEGQLASKAAGDTPKTLSEFRAKQKIRLGDSRFGLGSREFLAKVSKLSGSHTTRLDELRFENNKLRQDTLLKAELSRRSKLYSRSMMSSEAWSEGFMSEVGYFGKGSVSLLGSWLNYGKPTYEVIEGLSLGLDQSRPELLRREGYSNVLKSLSYTLTGWGLSKGLSFLGIGGLPGLALSVGIMLGTSLMRSNNYTAASREERFWDNIANFMVNPSGSLNEAYGAPGKAVGNAIEWGMSIPMGLLSLAAKPFGFVGDELTGPFIANQYASMMTGWGMTNFTKSLLLPMTAYNKDWIRKLDGYKYTMGRLKEASQADRQVSHLHPFLLGGTSSVQDKIHTAKYFKSYSSGGRILQPFANGPVWRISNLMMMELGRRQGLDDLQVAGLAAQRLTKQQPGGIAPWLTLGGILASPLLFNQLTKSGLGRGIASDAEYLTTRFSKTLGRNIFGNEYAAQREVFRLAEQAGAGRPNRVILDSSSLTSYFDSKYNHIYLGKQDATILANYHRGFNVDPIRLQGARFNALHEIGHTIYKPGTAIYYIDPVNNTLISLAKQSVLETAKDVAVQGKGVMPKAQIQALFEEELFANQFAHNSLRTITSKGTQVLDLSSYTDDVIADINTRYDTLYSSAGDSGDFLDLDFKYSGATPKTRIRPSDLRFGDRVKYNANRAYDLGYRKTSRRPSTMKTYRTLTRKAGESDLQFRLRQRQQLSTRRYYTNVDYTKGAWGRFSSSFGRAGKAFSDSLKEVVPERLIPDDATKFMKFRIGVAKFSDSLGTTPFLRGLYRASTEIGLGRYLAGISNIVDITHGITSIDKGMRYGQKIPNRLAKGYPINRTIEKKVRTMRSLEMNSLLTTLAALSVRGLSSNPLASIGAIYLTTQLPKWSPTYFGLSSKLADRDIERAKDGNYIAPLISTPSVYARANKSYVGAEAAARAFTKPFVQGTKNFLGKTVNALLSSKVYPLALTAFAISSFANYHERSALHTKWKYAGSAIKSQYGNDFEKYYQMNRSGTRRTAHHALGGYLALGAAHAAYRIPKVKWAINEGLPSVFKFLNNPKVRAIGTVVGVGAYFIGQHEKNKGLREKWDNATPEFRAKYRNNFENYYQKNRSGLLKNVSYPLIAYSAISLAPVVAHAPVLAIRAVHALFNTVIGGIGHVLSKGKPNIKDNKRIKQGTDELKSLITKDGKPNWGTKALDWIGDLLKGGLENTRGFLEGLGKAWQWTQIPKRWNQLGNFINDQIKTPIIGWLEAPWARATKNFLKKWSGYNFLSRRVFPAVGNLVSPARWGMATGKVRGHLSNVTDDIAQKIGRFGVKHGWGNVLLEGSGWAFDTYNVVEGSRRISQLDKRSSLADYQQAYSMAYAGRGSITGTIIGSMLFGPFGGFVGGVVGSVIDSSLGYHVGTKRHREGRTGVGLVWQDMVLGSIPHVAVLGTGAVIGRSIYRSKLKQRWETLPFDVDKKTKKVLTTKGGLSSFDDYARVNHNRVGWFNGFQKARDLDNAQAYVDYKNAVARGETPELKGKLKRYAAGHEAKLAQIKARNQADTFKNRDLWRAANPDSYLQGEIAQQNRLAWRELMLGEFEKQLPTTWASFSDTPTKSARAQRLDYARKDWGGRIITPRSNVGFEHYGPNPMYGPYLPVKTTEVTTPKPKVEPVTPTVTTPSTTTATKPTYFTESGLGDNYIRPDQTGKVPGVADDLPLTPQQVRAVVKDFEKSMLYSGGTDSRAISAIVQMDQTQMSRQAVITRALELEAHGVQVRLVMEERGKNLSPALQDHFTKMEIVRKQHFQGDVFAAEKIIGEDLSTKGYFDYSLYEAPGEYNDINRYYDYLDYNPANASLKGVSKRARARVDSIITKIKTITGADSVTEEIVEINGIKSVRFTPQYNNPSAHRQGVQKAQLDKQRGGYSSKEDYLANVKKQKEELAKPLTLAEKKSIKTRELEGRLNEWADQGDNLENFWKRKYEMNVAWQQKRGILPPQTFIQYDLDILNATNLNQGKPLQTILVGKDFDGFIGPVYKPPAPRSLKSQPNVSAKPLSDSNEVIKNVVEQPPGGSTATSPKLNIEPITSLETPPSSTIPPQTPANIVNASTPNTPTAQVPRYLESNPFQYGPPSPTISSQTSANIVNVTSVSSNKPVVREAVYIKAEENIMYAISQGKPLSSNVNYDIQISSATITKDKQKVGQVETLSGSPEVLDTPEKLEVKTVNQVKPQSFTPSTTPEIKAFKLDPDEIQTKKFAKAIVLEELKDSDVIITKVELEKRLNDEIFYLTSREFTSKDINELIANHNTFLESRFNEVAVAIDPNFPQTYGQMSDRIDRGILRLEPNSKELAKALQGHSMKIRMPDGKLLVTEDVNLIINYLNQVGTSRSFIDVLDPANTNSLSAVDAQLQYIKYYELMAKASGIDLSTPQARQAADLVMPLAPIRVQKLQDNELGNFDALKSQIEINAKFSAESSKEAFLATLSHETRHSLQLGFRGGLWNQPINSPSNVLINPKLQLSTFNTPFPYITDPSAVKGYVKSTWGRKHHRQVEGLIKDKLGLNTIKKFVRGLTQRIFGQTTYSEDIEFDAHTFENSTQVQDINRNIIAQGLDDTYNNINDSMVIPGSTGKSFYQGNVEDLSAIIKGSYIANPAPFGYKTKLVAPSIASSAPVTNLPNLTPGLVTEVNPYYTDLTPGYHLPISSPNKAPKVSLNQRLLKAAPLVLNTVSNVFTALDIYGLNKGRSILNRLDTHQDSMSRQELDEQAYRAYYALITSRQSLSLGASDLGYTLFNVGSRMIGYGDQITKSRVSEKFVQERIRTRDFGASALFEYGVASSVRDMRYASIAGSTIKGGLNAYHNYYRATGNKVPLIYRASQMSRGARLAQLKAARTPLGKLGMWGKVTRVGGNVLNLGMKIIDPIVGTVGSYLALEEAKNAKTEEQFIALQQRASGSLTRATASQAAGFIPGGSSVTSAILSTGAVIGADQVFNQLGRKRGEFIGKGIIESGVSYQEAATRQQQGILGGGLVGGIVAGAVIVGAIVSGIAVSIPIGIGLVGMGLIAGAYAGYNMVSDYLTQPKKPSNQPAKPTKDRMSGLRNFFAGFGGKVHAGEIPAGAVQIQPSTTYLDPQIQQRTYEEELLRRENELERLDLSPEERKLPWYKRLGQWVMAGLGAAGRAVKSMWSNLWGEKSIWKRMWNWATQKRRRQAELDKQANEARAGFFDPHSELRAHLQQARTKAYSAMNIPYRQDKPDFSNITTLQQLYDTFNPSFGFVGGIADVEAIARILPSEWGDNVYTQAIMANVIRNRVMVAQSGNSAIGGVGGANTTYKQVIEARGGGEFSPVRRGGSYWTADLSPAQLQEVAEALYLVASGQLEQSLIEGKGISAPLTPEQAKIVLNSLGFANPKVLDPRAYGAWKRIWNSPSVGVLSASGGKSYHEFASQQGALLQQYWTQAQSKYSVMNIASNKPLTSEELANIQLNDSAMRGLLSEHFNKVTTIGPQEIPQGIGIGGLVGGVALDTGVVAVMDGGGSPFHLHNQLNYGSREQDVQIMDAIALGYRAIGREMVFSNSKVRKLKWNPDLPLSEKLKLLEKIKAAHHNRSGNANKAVDFYAVEIGSELLTDGEYRANPTGKSGQLAPVLIPYIQGGYYTISPFQRGSVGNRISVFDASGNKVLEVYHGGQGTPGTYQMDAIAAQQGVQVRAISSTGTPATLRKLTDVENKLVNNQAGSRTKKFLETARAKGYTPQLVLNESDRVTTSYKDAGGNAISLHKDAAAAFEQMKQDAAAAGIDLSIVSGYRSISQQASIIQNKIDRNMTDEQILKYSAPAGFSEHQTGMAIDINSVNPADFEPGGKYYKVGQWLQANASKYGFNMTYGKNSNKGAGYEPWHYMYQGNQPQTSSQVANAITSSGVYVNLTPDEKNAIVNELQAGNGYTPAMISVYFQLLGNVQPEVKKRVLEEFEKFNNALTPEKKQRLADIKSGKIADPWAKFEQQTRQLTLETLPSTAVSSEFTQAVFGNPNASNQAQVKELIGAVPISALQPIKNLLLAGEGGVESAAPATTLKAITGRSSSQLSLADINKYQDAESGPKLRAVGYLQIIPDTFDKYVAAVNPNMNAKFNEKSQDQMFIWLAFYKRPEIGRYLLGLTDDLQEAGQALAREWAAIGLQYAEAPATQLRDSDNTITADHKRKRNRGQSLYEGVNNNAASISPERAIQALQQSRANIESNPQLKARLTTLYNGGNQSSSTIDINNTSTTQTWNPPKATGPVIKGKAKAKQKILIGIGHQADPHTGASGPSSPPGSYRLYSNAAGTRSLESAMLIRTQLIFSQVGSSLGYDVQVFNPTMEEYRGPIGSAGEAKARGKRLDAMVAQANSIDAYAVELHYNAHTRNSNLEGVSGVIVPTANPSVIDEKLGEAFGYFPQSISNNYGAVKKGITILEIGPADKTIEEAFLKGVNSGDWSLFDKLVAEKARLFYKQLNRAGVGTKQSNNTSTPNTLLSAIPSSTIKSDLQNTALFYNQPESKPRDNNSNPIATQQEKVMPRPQVIATEIPIINEDLVLNFGINSEELGLVAGFNFFGLFNRKDKKNKKSNPPPTPPQAPVQGPYIIGPIPPGVTKLRLTKEQQSFRDNVMRTSDVISLAEKYFNTKALPVYVEGFDYLAKGLLELGLTGEIFVRSLMARIIEETWGLSSTREKYDSVPNSANMTQAEKMKAYFEQKYGITGKNPGLAKELGNTKPGEGGIYYGRGPLQLTGKYNYEQFYKYLRAKGINKDVVANPDLIQTDPQIMAESVLFFIVNNPIGYSKQTIYDAGSKGAGGMEKFVKIINGGSNGLDKTVDIFNKLNSMKGKLQSRNIFLDYRAEPDTLPVEEIVALNTSLSELNEAVEVYLDVVRKNEEKREEVTVIKLPPMSDQRTGHEDTVANKPVPTVSKQAEVTVKKDGKVIVNLLKPGQYINDTLALVDTVDYSNNNYLDTV